MLLQRSVYKWIKKCKNSRTSVKDEERSGRPTSSTTNAIIQTNQRVTVDKFEYYLQIGHGSLCEFIHNRHAFRKGWIPKHLTEKHKRNRVAICQRLLDRCANEGEAFLKRLVTEDETWINLFEPETKHQSMEWKPVSYTHLSDP